MIEGEQLKLTSETNLKYLVIAALAVLVFIVVYSRLRPYLQLIRKVVSFLNNSAATTTGVSQKPSNPKSERQLVRCESCGTWVPTERALKLSSGLTTYCSRECLEKSAQSKEHRAAG
jgi:ribosomal protein S14